MKFYTTGSFGQSPVMLRRVLLPVLAGPTHCFFEFYPIFHLGGFLLFSRYAKRAKVGQYC